MPPSTSVILTCTTGCELPVGCGPLAGCAGWVGGLSVRRTAGESTAGEKLAAESGGGAMFVGTASGAISLSDPAVTLNLDEVQNGPGDADHTSKVRFWTRERRHTSRDCRRGLTYPGLAVRTIPVPGMCEIVEQARIRGASRRLFATESIVAQLAISAGLRTLGCLVLTVTGDPGR